MVDAFAGARCEREAAGDDGAFGGAKGIEDGLGELFGPDGGGEGVSIDGNVDAALGFVGYYADFFRGGILPCSDTAHREGKDDNYRACPTAESTHAGLSSSS